MATAYATLAERVNAATLDSVIIVAGFIMVPLVLGPSTITPLLMLFILLLVEPTSIRLFGCSPGQALLRLQVQPAGEVHLGLPRLVLRYLTKVILGGVSVGYMLFSRDHQAIHDHMLGSKVISSRREGSSEAVATEQLGLPGPWRRFGVSLVWCGLVGLPITIAFSVILMLLLAPIAPEVFDENNESALFVDAPSSIFFVGLSLWLMELGADGRLLGARRHPPAGAGHKPGGSESSH